MRRPRPRFVSLSAAVSAMALLALSFVTAQDRAVSSFRRVTRPVPGRYIVLLREGIATESVAGAANDLAKQHGGTTRKIFPGFRMFSIHMPEAAAIALSRNPTVEFVEEAAIVSSDAVQPINFWDPNFFFWQPWGLDRIDQRFYPGDLSFTYPGSSKSVAVYIIDSGVRPTHAEFVSNGFSRAIVRDFRGENGIDCNGHGTHVAGTVAGRTFGILKHTTFESLRVLDCGGADGQAHGTTDDIIDAVYYVTFSGQRPAVVNMSLGGDPSDAMDYAVRRSIGSGAVYVIAAGNGNIDAGNTSPARVSEAIVVGNSNRNDDRSVTDATHGSNFGPYLDLFAPGAIIRSAAIFGDQYTPADFSTTFMSGTSMAAPHVTGVVALFLNGHRNWSPADVQSWLTANATADVLGNIGAGSPNRLLYSGFVNDAADVIVSIPDKMVPGRQYNASVTVANNGATTWENFAAAQREYWLGIQSNNWGIQWVRQPWLSRVRPDEQLTFNFTVTAPTTPGVYPFQWQMLQNQADWFGARPTRMITVGALADDAQFVSQSVPDRMVPGRQYRVSVCMRNVGSTMWSPTEYVLRAQSPEGNWMWGLSAVDMPFDGSGAVPPGGEVTFNFVVTAPGIDAPFQWRMSKATGDSFGDYSPSVSVRTAEWADDAEFVSMHAPWKVRPGSPYWMSVTFRNRGTSTWVRNPYASSPSGTGVLLTGTAFGQPMELLLPRPSVAPGEYVTFTLAATPSANPAIQHSEWHLVSLECPLCFEDQTQQYTAFGSGSFNMASHLGNWTDEAGFVSYSVPSPMVPGQTYPVSVTMENRGTTTWTAADEYWLGSLEGVTELHNFNQVLPVPSVPPGGRVTFSFNVTAPTTPGVYRMGWQMVYAGPAEPPVSRYFGSNAPVAVITVAPGTVPASIGVTVANAPVNWPLNSVQRITWTHNLGSNSYVNVDFSRDAGVTWSPIATVLKNSGATTGTYDWFITPDYPEGGYSTTNGRVRVSWVDGPASDMNNAAIVIGTTIAPASSRDLVVSSLTDPPATIVPGATFTTTDTTRNQGTIDAGTSTTRYYLSADDLKGAGDVLLAPSRAIPALVAGSESTGTIALTVPATTPAGAYHLLACADDKAVNTESNEVNNCRPSAGVMTVQLPDLVVTAVNHPGAAAPGGSATVGDTVRNLGSATAGASSTRFFASTDAVRDATDVLLTGSRSVAALDPGSASSGTRSVTIPSSLPLGTYRILACADDQLKVREASETNNCSPSAMAMVVGLPDLVATGVSANAAWASPGGKLTVSDTTVNQGNATGPASATGYYLSVDVAKDAGDVLLTGARSVASLAPGASSSGSKTVTVPLTVAEGMYQLLACADVQATVKELSDANNCVAAASSIRIGRPDLVVSSLSNGPAEAVRGGQFGITDTVQNIGDVPAVSSTNRYYFSPTPDKANGAILLAATRSINGLSAGASSTGSKTLTVPLAMNSGTYYLVACSDGLSKINERDETNNCRAAASSMVIK